MHALTRARAHMQVESDARYDVYVAREAAMHDVAEQLEISNEEATKLLVEHSFDSERVIEAHKRNKSPAWPSSPPGGACAPVYVFFLCE